MKNYVIIHILVFILCMLVYQCATAQDQDYLVTLHRDTIHGEIKPIMYGKEKKVQVTTVDDDKKIFSVVETLAFHREGEIFHTVKGPSGYTFMKLLKSGYLSLYAFQSENSNTFDGRYLYKKDGTGIEVPNLGFKKHMARFLNSCNVVLEKIEDGSLGKNQLDAIIDQYNQCIERNSSAVAQANKSAGTSKTNAPATSEAQQFNPWDALENGVREHNDFEGKADALEMINEIKNKLKRSEKIPNFLTEGLKSTLSGEPDLNNQLDAALKTVN